MNIRKNRQYKFRTVVSEVSSCMGYPVFTALCPKMFQGDSFINKTVIVLIEKWWTQK